MAKLKFIRSYDEAGNIRTFVFETAGASWKPGQYQTYNLSQVEGGDDAKQRFFTIASAPSENEIHISTRVSDSAFKQTLNSIGSGDTIEAHDIDGDFLWDDDKPVVLVAGGIGVTPYRSILLERDYQGQALPAHLLYFGRDDNFAFREEFNGLVNRHTELRIDYIIGEQISVDNILHHAPEAREQITYLSGPESMVDTIGEDLTKKGITIKQDWFPGYDETSY